MSSIRPIVRQKEEILEAMCKTMFINSTYFDEAQLECYINANENGREQNSKANENYHHDHYH